MQVRELKERRARRQFAAALVMFGAALMMAGSLPMQAFALEEGQTGTGETSLVMRVSDTSERGGTRASGDYANPDENGDGLGDNLAFSVPIRIDFAALSDGSVVGPSAGSAFIRNESYFGIRVSSLAVEAKNGWHIVEDAAADSQANAIDLEIGPNSDQLKASDYLSKASVKTPREWNMSAKTASSEGGRVVLSGSGHINNISADIAQETTFGQINWYVTPGSAE